MRFSTTIATLVPARSSTLLGTEKTYFIFWETPESWNTRVITTQGAEGWPSPASFHRGWHVSGLLPRAPMEEYVDVYLCSFSSASTKKPRTAQTHTRFHPYWTLWCWCCPTSGLTSWATGTRCSGMEDWYTISSVCESVSLVSLAPHSISGTAEWSGVERSGGVELR